MAGPHADSHLEEPGADPRSRIRALQVIPTTLRLSHTIAAVLRFALLGCALWAWYHHLWVVVVPIWVVVAWMDHAALTRLHEAAHGTLIRTRWINETIGVIIGTLALTPLSVYRFVHHQHHAYVGHPKDPEFWPYTDPSTSRGLRLAYAWSELVFGWIMTPLLYSVRTARSWNTIVPHQRRRLMLEWTVMAATWGGILAVVAADGWWAQLVVVHFAPAWITGTFQSLRKFTEHLGMFGEGILGMTRTVAHEHLFGWSLSRSQLHVDHHGTHHRWARIPYYSLPEATGIVYGEAPEGHLFRTYWGAMLDMAPHLLNPRLGPQWKPTGPHTSEARIRSVKPSKSAHAPAR